MTYANDPMGAALDRHITGNYGEDQYTHFCPMGGGMSRTDDLECEENCRWWDNEKGCTFSGEDDDE
jgi:hypothetical protein